MRSALAVLVSIAAAHLRIRLRQTVVAVGGVAIGVGFFLAVSGMMSGSQKDFIRTLVDSAPHIIVTDQRRGRRDNRRRRLFWAAPFPCVTPRRGTRCGVCGTGRPCSRTCARFPARRLRRRWGRRIPDLCRANRRRGADRRGSSD